MAEQNNAEGLSSQISAPFNTSDYEVMKGMRVPETITVNPDRGMQNTADNRPAFQGNQMIVPEKIVLKGGVESGTQVSPNVALQNAGVNLDDYMGGMVTPPRTLTVDDTRSRYMERNMDGNDSQGAAEEFDRLSHKLIKGSGGAENSDFKLQGEIVQLKKRVESLEKKVVEKQSNGFWKTTFVCLLTIINPIIIHWLFSSRRR